MIMPLPTLVSMLHLKVSYPSASVIGYLWFLGFTSDDYNVRIYIVFEPCAKFSQLVCEIISIDHITFQVMDLFFVGLCCVGLLPS